jgi:Prion-inhibition and propagation
MPLAAATIAGLTTGSIGFAITLYRTTLDLYSVFTTASSLGQDAHVLQAQLLIQETLFKRWGDGVGLTKGSVEDVDERLKQDGEGSLFQAVVVALSSAKQVLSDTEKLKKSYGLEGSDEQTGGGQLLVELRGMYLVDSAVVVEDYRRRKDEAEKMQIRVGIMQKLKWVIKDKEKFGKLVERLTGLNNGLYSLIEPLEASILAKAVVGELLRTLDLARLRVLCTAAKATSNASDVASLAALRQRAVEITRFPDSIPDMELPGTSKGLTLFSAGRGERRTVGSYQGEKNGTPEPTKLVLVEWKIIESNLTGQEKEILDATTNSLAFFLNHNNKSEGLRSLTCIGVTKPVSQSAESIRYGLVYDLPGKSTEKKPLLSLFEMLRDDKNEIDLGNKFLIAQVLVQPLHELHVANWLHKAICSENVLFIRQSGASGPRGQISASSVYLAGYEFSRPGRLRDPTQPAGDVVRSVYAHPAYRGGDIKYRRLFDIYSLGVVLLEIGLWQNAVTSVRPGLTANNIQELLIESCEEELGPAMGRVYRNAVHCCLTGDFAVEGLNSVNEDEPNWLEMTADEIVAMEQLDEQMNADLTASFYWKVVQPLRKLYA